MKRLATLLLLLCFTAPASRLVAQDALESIRKQYAEIKERIQRMSEPDSWPPEFYQVGVSQNLPGTGLHREDIRMYYDEVRTKEDEIYPPHRICFASSKYNFAARKFYEEYLYDESGKAVFIYARNPDFVFGLDYDFRFYLNKGKLIWAVIKCRPVEGAILSAITDIWDASAPTDSEGFRKMYEGSKPPEEYKAFYAGFLQSATKFPALFKAIDGSTYR